VLVLVSEADGVVGAWGEDCDWVPEGFVSVELLSAGGLGGLGCRKTGGPSSFSITGADSAWCAVFAGAVPAACQVPSAIHEFSNWRAPPAVNSP